MTHHKAANRFWGSVDRPKTKTEFFDAVTTPTPGGDGTVATIRLYGPIDSWGGYWGISTKDVGQVLDALPDTVSQIILRLNSPGGEVFEAVSILNMFRAHRASVTAVVDGLAASAASFIAAGCDEVVMSPGTQMMIHSPWGIEIGNARDMRKHADILDGLETSMIELYTAKAGEKNWSDLLAEDTWLPAAEAVALGLADRIGVVPDAGETATAGEEVPEIVVVPLSDDEDSGLVTRIATFGRVPTLPSSTEPGDPNRKEEAVAYSDLKAGLAKRLGVTDADPSDEILLAAADEALGERAEATIPEGAIVVDKGAYEELKNDAKAGREAKDSLDSQRRDGIVAKAMSEGRIAASSRDTWRAQLDKDETGAAALLASLPQNTIPVVEIGHSDEVLDADAALYASAFGSDTVKGA